MYEEFRYDIPLMTWDDESERRFVGDMAVDLARALEKKFGVTLAVESLTEGFRVVSRARKYAAEQNQQMSLYAEAYVEGYEDGCAADEGADDESSYEEE